MRTGSGIWYDVQAAVLDLVRIQTHLLIFKFNLAIWVLNTSSVYILYTVKSLHMERQKG